MAYFYDIMVFCRLLFQLLLAHVTIFLLLSDL